MAYTINPVNSYPVGNLVRMTANFYDINNNLVDPTTVVLFVSGPQDSRHQYSPVRDSVGLYHYDFLTSTPGGKWYYRFVGSGAVTAQSSDTPFSVQFTQF